MADQSLSPNLDLPIFPRYPGIARALAHHLARRARHANVAAVARQQECSYRLGYARRECLLRTRASRATSAGHRPLVKVQKHSSCWVPRRRGRRRQKCGRSPMTGENETRSSTGGIRSWRSRSHTPAVWSMVVSQSVRRPPKGRALYRD